MTVTSASTAATIVDIWLRAPAPSLTAVCDKLPPVASPPSNPDPTFAVPSATISWLGSRR